MNTTVQPNKVSSGIVVDLPANQKFTFQEVNDMVNAINSKGDRLKKVVVLGAGTEQDITASLIVPVDPATPSYYNDIFRFNATGSTLFKNPVGGYVGQVIQIEHTQGAGGPFLPTFGTLYRFPDNHPKPDDVLAMSQVEGGTDKFYFEFNGTTWDCFNILYNFLNA